MGATPTQILASLRLGRNVTEWASERRAEEPQPSYRKIAAELRQITGGQVDVTDETIRLWVVATLKEKHGACPFCSRPTWHNGDPCPHEQVEAAS